MRQRALKIWEPVLGESHPMIKVLYARLASLRSKSPVNMNAIPLDPTEPREEEALDLTPQLGSRLSDLLHLESRSPDQLLGSFRAFEISESVGGQMSQELLLLRRGRARSLEGVYFSSLGRYDAATVAFQDSDRIMEHEICVEIKLHRILWYAAHSTEVKDWDNAGRLLREAHHIFMENDEYSPFILHHFPKRFKVLCIASERYIPVDQVVSEEDDGSIAGQIPNASGNSTPRVGHIPSTVLADQHLFQPAPNGINAPIDIDLWCRFVLYSSPEKTSLIVEED